MPSSQVGSHSLSTRDRGIAGAMAEFIEASSTSESTILLAAHLTEQDYRLARLSIPEMAAFQDYEDWLDFRMGTFWGLEMAGFDGRINPGGPVGIYRWRRLTSAAPSIVGARPICPDQQLRIDRNKRQEDRPSRLTSQIFARANDVRYWSAAIPVRNRRGLG